MRILYSIYGDDCEAKNTKEVMLKEEIMNQTSMCLDLLKRYTVETKVMDLD